MSPTSLEQIFHTFAKEQTGAEEQGVYDNKKELALTQLLEDIAGSCVGANSECRQSYEDAGSALRRLRTDAWLSFFTDRH